MTRFFISWYPDPPDPRYWDWFEIDGLTISLGVLQGKTLNRALATGVHGAIGFGGRVFLDCGAFQNSGVPSPGSQLRVLEQQSWLRPDLASHLDLPFIDSATRLTDKERWNHLKVTIDNAFICRQWQKRNDLQIVYVIQGWDENSTRLCAQEMSRLEADYYALGSLYRRSADEIVRRVQLVRGIIPKDARLHLFGVNPAVLVRSPFFAAIADKVDSLDCSTPIRAACVREVVDVEGLTRVHINDLHSSLLNCECPVCRKFPGRIGVGGLEGKRRLNNRMRAVHNAYWITKVSRGLSTAPGKR